METYLVRIWESAEPDVPNGEVRGFVRRVYDGQEAAFIGIEQLLERLDIKDSQEGPRSELSRP